MPRARPAARKAIHEDLGKVASSWADLEGPLLRYCLRRGVSHWLAASAPMEARRLLVDFAGLVARMSLEGPAGAQALADDVTATLRSLPADEQPSYSPWDRFFRDRVHLLRRDEAWPAERTLLQLAVEHADDSPVSRAAEAWSVAHPSGEPWLWRLHRPRRIPTSPCVRVYEAGHALQAEPVELIMAAVTPSGQVFARDTDDGLWWWNTHTGELAGHAPTAEQATEALPVGLLDEPEFSPWSGEGEGRVALPQGGSIRWAWLDLTIELGDGREVAHPGAHTNNMIGAMALDAHRAITWAWDGVIRVWSTDDGGALGELRGHTMGVWGCRSLADGQLLSWSQDSAVRLWDPGRATTVEAGEGHRGQVHAAAPLDPERLLTWGDDGRFLMWSAATGDLLGEPCEAVEALMGAEVLTGGRVVAWDAMGGTHVLHPLDARPGRVLKWSQGDVLGATQLGDERIVTWDHTGRIVVWSLDDGSAFAIQAHEAWVTSVRDLGDGTAVSTSGDKTLARWSIEDGEIIDVLAGHGDVVDGSLTLPGGWLLSWARDGELMLWDFDRARRTTLATLGRDVIDARVVDDRLVVRAGGTFARWSLPSMVRLPDVASDDPGPTAHALRKATSSARWVRGDRLVEGGYGLTLWLDAARTLRWISERNTWPLLLRDDGIMVAFAEGHLVWVKLQETSGPP